MKQIKKLDINVKVKIVTDKEELNRKGHDNPVLVLYNDIISVWIPIKDMSFSRIEYELERIERVTKMYMKENYI